MSEKLIEIRDNIENDSPKNVNKTYQKLTILALVLLFFLYLVYLNHHLFSIKSFTSILNVEKIIESKNNCSCRKDVVVLVKRNSSYVIHVDKGVRNDVYFIDSNQININKATCDLYNVLRRGPNQNVIGYSLYGSNMFYYKEMKTLSKMIAKYYPKWIMRVYYDDSVNKEFICELECLKNESNNEFIDNVDFCYVNKMPFGSDDRGSFWNASYMHSMSWRWLPIGDPFVDMFMSRDSDSWITDREYESVKVWLESSTLFHIMRDHPQHGVPILGGMWGYANSRNRKLANKLFGLMIDKSLAFKYNNYSQKGKDQDFLGANIWSFAKLNATIHDSYFCNVFDGKPFPTQRPTNFCFVACSYCCNSTIYNVTWKDVCPEGCRPHNHKDWIYC